MRHHRYEGLPICRSDARVDRHAERHSPARSRERHRPGAAVWASPTAAVEPAENGLPLTEIRNVNRSFDPALAMVPVGTSVRFLNEDPFFSQHLFHSDADPFDLGFYSIGPARPFRSRIPVSFACAATSIIRCTRSASSLTARQLARTREAGHSVSGGVASKRTLSTLGISAPQLEQNAPLVYPCNAKNVSSEERLN